MPNSLVNQTYTELLNTVVALICGEDGVSLVTFSENLEKVVKQMVADGSRVEDINKLLVEVEQALKKNDFILLLDVVYLLLKNERVTVIDKAD